MDEKTSEEAPRRQNKSAEKPVVIEGVSTDESKYQEAPNKGTPEKSRWLTSPLMIGITSALLLFWVRESEHHCKATGILN
jgi:hypothetical protein